MFRLTVWGGAVPEPPAVLSVGEPARPHHRAVDVLLRGAAVRAGGGGGGGAVVTVLVGDISSYSNSPGGYCPAQTQRDNQNTRE